MTEFKKWLYKKNEKFTSPGIQNGILKDMALLMLRDVNSTASWLMNPRI